jgi:hypothetical protein
MLLLTKKINIRLPREDRVHSFLKSIPDKLWQGWTITRKQNTSNLNFSVTNTTNVKIRCVLFARNCPTLP